MPSGKLGAISQEPHTRLLDLEPDEKLELAQGETGSGPGHRPPARGAIEGQHGSFALLSHEEWTTRGPGAERTVSKSLVSGPVQDGLTVTVGVRWRGITHGGTARRNGRDFEGVHQVPSDRRSRELSHARIGEPQLPPLPC